MSTKYFDWVFYSNFYSDLKAAHINTECSAIEHYKTHGISEKRITNINIENFLKTNDKNGTSLFNNICNERVFSMNKYFVEYILNDCSISSDSRIVEIGCGIGCFSLPIIKTLTTGKYYGIDSNVCCIDWCKSNIAPVCKSEFISMNNIHLPFNDNEIDFIYSTTLFAENPPNKMSIIMKEINRVLKKGGHFVFSAFISSQAQTQIFTKNEKHKIRIKSVDGTQIIINHKGEKGYLHPDNEFIDNLRVCDFEIKDTIFGNWAHTSNNLQYNDIIDVVK